jgi:hypothetical protein
MDENRDHQPANASTAEQDVDAPLEHVAERGDDPTAPDVDALGALTEGEQTGSARIVDLDSEAEQQRGRRALEALFGADGPSDVDIDALTGPVHWPSLPAAQLAERFAELRIWVEELMERFEHLDHSVIPPCWWQHNGHVEALQALKDHERVSFADTSPGQAALTWHRDFQFLELRLREWTSFYGCDRDRHRAPIRSVTAVDEPGWQAHLEAERARRTQRERDHTGAADSDAARPEPGSE